MARLSDADPRLQEAWTLLKVEFQDAHPGKDLLLTCVYRSPEAQQALYAQGRTTPGQIVTQIDGITKKSNHNLTPARALDFAVVVGGKISWDPTEYRPVGALAEARGLVWGGNWPHFKDYPHLELPHASENT